MPRLILVEIKLNANPGLPRSRDVSGRGQIPLHYHFMRLLRLSRLPHNCGRLRQLVDLFQVG